MLSIRKPSRKNTFCSCPKKQTAQLEINNMSLRLSGVPGFPLGAIKTDCENHGTKKSASDCLPMNRILRQSYKEPAFFICCSRLARSPLRKTSSPFCIWYRTGVTLATTSAPRFWVASRLRGKSRWQGCRQQYVYGTSGLRIQLGNLSDLG